MKKVVVFCLAVSSSLTLNAQPNTFPASGNVGIGTLSPLAKLHVNGTTRLAGPLSLERASDNNDREISAYTSNQALYINANSHTTNGATIEMYGSNHSISDRRGSMRFISYGSVGEGFGFFNYDPLASTWRRTMTITNDNKVHIGTNSLNLPGSYGLYVERGILTEKVKVALYGSAGWADYVFADDYKLTPLPEVESFVKKNKHLPGVPSGQSLVDDGGIDVNQMLAKQMEKIEELTLYMIELEKQVKQLKSDNSLLMSAHHNTKN